MNNRMKPTGVIRRIDDPVAIVCNEEGKLDGLEMNRAELEASSLGRFLLEEVPWRVREVHEHAALSEDEVAELAWQLLNICLDYDAIDQCIEEYLLKK